MAHTPEEEEDEDEVDVGGGDTHHPLSMYNITFPSYSFHSMPLFCFFFILGTSTAVAINNS